ncbi:MAG: FkbM family methyltransferase [Planctomycetota bacterium]|nr:MAG: FkbM family methyltransferase [Planctomycetota bacterium]
MLRRLIRRYIGRIARRQAPQDFFEELQLLALKGLNIGEAFSIHNSGEFNDKIVNLLRESRSNIIFDVGANVGEYSRQMHLITGGKYKIYAFEPAAETFIKLSENLKNINVHLYNIGFGLNDEKLTLYSDNPTSGLASLYNRRLNHFGISMKHPQEVQIRRLDGFCSEMGIDHIGFLKLDVEGHELAVLRGSSSLLKNNKIDLIQFEFGGCNIDSRTFFQDFFYLLDSNYEIFRITRNGLQYIRKYKETHEVFITTNYLAVTRDMADKSDIKCNI